ncbi:hypothetical protein [Niallia alba]|uniref:hypothetical protein n=1 Tax=Niallia alba TaxID=2729105 RepID=UPI0039A22590
MLLEILRRIGVIIAYILGYILLFTAFVVITLFLFSSNPIAIIIVVISKWILLVLGALMGIALIYIFVDYVFIQPIKNNKNTLK